MTWVHVLQNQRTFEKSWLINGKFLQKGKYWACMIDSQLADELVLTRSHPSFFRGFLFVTKCWEGILEDFFQLQYCWFCMRFDSIHLRFGFHECVLFALYCKGLGFFHAVSFFCAGDTFVREFNLWGVFSHFFHAASRQGKKAHPAFYQPYVIDPLWFAGLIVYMTEFLAIFLMVINIWRFLHFRWPYILLDVCIGAIVPLKLVLEVLMLLILQISLHWWQWRWKLKVRN